MDHTKAVIPKITTPKTAVFAFQFLGWAYQPPAGDQTCLGYLGALELELTGMERELWMSGRDLRNLAARLDASYY
jgi:hypothetical protein